MWPRRTRRLMVRGRPTGSSPAGHTPHGPYLSRHPPLTPPPRAPALHQPSSRRPWPAARARSEVPNGPQLLGEQPPRLWVPPPRCDTCAPCQCDAQSPHPSSSRLCGDVEDSPCWLSAKALSPQRPRPLWGHTPGGARHAWHHHHLRLRRQQSHTLPGGEPTLRACLVLSTPPARPQLRRRGPNCLCACDRMLWPDADTAPRGAHRTRCWPSLGQWLQSPGSWPATAQATAAAPQRTATVTAKTT